MIKETLKSSKYSKEINSLVDPLFEAIRISEDIRKNLESIYTINKSDMSPVTSIIYFVSL